MDFKFVSHKDEVIQALEDADDRALDAIGSKAAGYALMLAPADTGRLRNSITWATKRNEGKPYTYTDDNGKTYTDTIGTGCEEDTVYVGTNVEYAIYQEMGPSAGSERRFKFHPYLKPAIVNHLEEYKRIAMYEFQNAV